MVRWVAPSVHVADSYRSGGGQGAAGTLPERRLCLYEYGMHLIWGRLMFTDGCAKDRAVRQLLRDEGDTFSDDV